VTVAGRESLIAVTGAGGQVGTALREFLPAGRFLPRSEVDVLEPEAVRLALEGAGVIIHLAAITNVDECERSPKRAFAVNAEGTRNVVEAAHLHGSRVIYLSTDYVFDGEKPEEYNEEDEPWPLSVYGRSKLRGERYVAIRRENLVVRTSWIFGSGRNFPRTMIEAARAGGPIHVVDDQSSRPTSAGHLAKALAHLARRSLSGILHVAGDGRPCGRAELAEKAITMAGLSVVVDRIDSEAYARRSGQLLARRPRNSALALSRARQLGVPLDDWQAALRRYVDGLT
jgi:dTDP-4-dehydrorhamnose reductase